MEVPACGLKPGDVVGEGQALWAVEVAWVPSAGRVVAYWGGSELAWGGGVQDEAHRLSWDDPFALVRVIRTRP